VRTKKPRLPDKAKGDLAGREVSSSGGDSPQGAASTIPILHKASKRSPFGEEK